MIYVISIAVSMFVVTVFIYRWGFKREKDVWAAREALAAERSLSESALAAAASRYAMLEEAMKSRDKKAETLEIAERKNREYFDLIERVLAQRDEWKDMFFEHSIEHQRGQALLESEIMRTREYLMRTIKIVNEYREKNGEPPLESPFATIKDHPVGTSERFGKKMDAMKSRAPTPVDGIRDRDAIKNG